MNRFSLSEGTRTALRRYLGYPLFFIFAFLTSAYLTFPYERVRDVIEQQVTRAIPGSELEIVSLEPSWISGVEAHGVLLRLPSSTEGERPQQSVARPSCSIAPIEAPFHSTLKCPRRAQMCRTTSECAK